MFVLLTGRLDSLVSNIEEYLDPRLNLSYKFENKISQMLIIDIVHSIDTRHFSHL